LRAVGRVADLEGDAERVLQLLDGLLLVPEQEVEDAEVVQEPADVDGVVDRLVDLDRPLRVRTRLRPAAVPLRDERGLEMRVCDGFLVARRLRELERTLDVLARRLPVAVAAVAARAPLKDVRAKPVAALARPVGELERGAEVLERLLDVVQLVAAAREAVEHLGAVDVP